MATKKNNKNKITPKFDITVDITSAESMNDVYTAFAEAKIDKSLTRNEYNSLVDSIIDKYGVQIYVCEGKCPFCDNKPAKKPNIFKRIWNWITGK